LPTFGRTVVLSRLTVVVESRQPRSVVLGTHAPKDGALCFYKQRERVRRASQSGVAVKRPGQGSVDALPGVQDQPENLEAGVRYVRDGRKGDAQLRYDRGRVRAACREPDEPLELQHQGLQATQECRRRRLQ